MLVAELRHLSEHCECGITLHEMLRDRLVCGVRDIRIQRWLLAEAKLTLKRALDLALGTEAAYKNASEIQKADGQGGDPSVNKVDAKVNKGSEVKWFCCGGNHYPQVCHLKNAKCYCCGKVRRLAHLCPTKKKGNNLIQLMSRNQLQIFQSSWRCNANIRGGTASGVHITCFTLGVKAHHLIKYS